MLADETWKMKKFQKNEENNEVVIWKQNLKVNPSSAYFSIN